MLVIKKYLNRKLYDTKKSCYITLTDVVEYVNNEVDFKVIQNKDKKDITNLTLKNALQYVKLTNEELINLISLNKGE